VTASNRAILSVTPRGPAPDQHGQTVATGVSTVLVVAFWVIFFIEIATCIYQIVATPPIRASSLLSVLMSAPDLCTPIASVRLQAAWGWRSRGIISPKPSPQGNGDTVTVTIQA
jgi:hypothetical protein